MQREVKKSSLTSLFDSPKNEKSSLTSLFDSPKNEMKRKQQYQFDDMSSEIEKSSLTSLFDSPKNEMKRKQQYQFDDMSSEIDSMHKESRDNEHKDPLETAGLGSGLGLRRNKSSALLFENNEEEVNIVPYKNSDIGFKSSMRRNESSALLYLDNEADPPEETTKMNYQNTLHLHNPEVIGTSYIEKSVVSPNSMLAAAYPLKRRSVEDLSQTDVPLVSALRQPQQRRLSSTEVAVARVRMARNAVSGTLSSNNTSESEDSSDEESDSDITKILNDGHYARSGLELGHATQGHNKMSLNFDHNNSSNDRHKFRKKSKKNKIEYAVRFADVEFSPPVFAPEANIIAIEESHEVENNVW
eukprot:CAMPEP_0119051116 /NCGR_PEP_ID=MMETSP1177-20130426/72840_1 /TAXON_ID=2985 /ORGANISM="Ochromonas sp, Strain CCMP1899" /LENGTH=356 /DNA_ID=CAMNT_0007030217 /DNA_START=274 /DNA_END=1341 /DNA_ORIENTATION=+